MKNVLSVIRLFILTLVYQLKVQLSFSLSGEYGDNDFNLNVGKFLEETSKEPIPDATTSAALPNTGESPTIIKGKDTPEILDADEPTDIVDPDESKTDDGTEGADKAAADSDIFKPDAKGVYKIGGKPYKREDILKSIDDDFGVDTSSWTDEQKERAVQKHLLAENGKNRAAWQKAQTERDVKLANDKKKTRELVDKYEKKIAELKPIAEGELTDEEKEKMTPEQIQDWKLDKRDAKNELKQTEELHKEASEKDVNLFYFQSAHKLTNEFTELTLSEPWQTIIGKYQLDPKSVNIHEYKKALEIADIITAAIQKKMPPVDYYRLYDGKFPAIKSHNEAILKSGIATKKAEAVVKNQSASVTHPQGGKPDKSHSQNADTVGKDRDAILRKLNA
ncbi:hypothetical protein BH10BAC5_BH10BAC5_17020 [soil metagenome]